MPAQGRMQAQVWGTHWPSAVTAGLLEIILAMPPSLSKESTSCTFLPVSADAYCSEASSAHTASLLLLSQGPQAHNKHRSVVA